MPAPRPRGRQPSRPRRARDQGLGSGRRPPDGSPPRPAGGRRRRGAMLRHGAPQALLLVGPASVGKATLALDLAAGILCHAERPGRPAVRSVPLLPAGRAGTHQDLHRLVPEGPGQPGPDRRPRGPGAGDGAPPAARAGPPPRRGRRTGSRSSRTPTASTRTPRTPCSRRSRSRPPGATLILCADEAERLLPTVRSRGAVLRLGPVGVRAMEGLLAERGVEPPRSAQPGAPRRRAPGPRGRPCGRARGRRRPRGARAVPARPGWRSERPIACVAGRELLARAADLVRTGGDARGTRRGPGSAAAVAAAAGRPDDAEASRTPTPTPGRRGTPAERRQAAAALLATWTAVARDLAVTAAGAAAAVRDMALLEELRAVAGGVAPEACAAFLGRLVRAAELLEANANPELLVDILVLAWPRTRAAGRRGDAGDATRDERSPDGPPTRAPRRDRGRPRAGRRLPLVRARRGAQPGPVGLGRERGRRLACVRGRGAAPGPRGPAPRARPPARSSATWSASSRAGARPRDRRALRDPLRGAHRGRLTGRGPRRRTGTIGGSAADHGDGHRGDAHPARPCGDARAHRRRDPAALYRRVLDAVERLERLGGRQEAAASARRPSASTRLLGRRRATASSRMSRAAPRPPPGAASAASSRASPEREPPPRRPPPRGPTRPSARRAGRRRYPRPMPDPAAGLPSRFPPRAARRSTRPGRFRGAGRAGRDDRGRVAVRHRPRRGRPRPAARGGRPRPGGAPRRRPRRRRRGRLRRDRPDHGPAPRHRLALDLPAVVELALAAPVGGDPPPARLRHRCRRSAAS